MGRRASLGVYVLLLAIGLLAAIPVAWRLAVSNPLPSSRPSPASPSYVTFRGRLIDIPGFSASLGILGATRVALLRDGRPIGEAVVPDVDGTFLLESPNSPGLALRVTTLLKVDLFDRTLDRTVSRNTPVLPTGPNLGDIPLPRSDEFGSIEFRVVDATGALLQPEWVALDAVEGTSTPDVGIARLDDLNAAANAPTAYRRGGRGTILHVPPGEYWVRATAANHFLPPIRVSVGRGPAAATIAERPSIRRVRGIVREMGVGWPLEDVEITVASAKYAGAGSRDPARVMGRTSRSGAYDLPMPDPMPEGGLRLSFVRKGYAGTDLNAKAEDFKGGRTLVLDLDLGRD